ncbi:MAG: hypothetical protein ACLVJ8_07015 [Ruthenibacterium lactatiformans]
MTGSVRSYDERVRATAERRIREISEGIAAFGRGGCRWNMCAGTIPSARSGADRLGANMIAQTFGTQAVHELSPIAPETIFAITIRCARFSRLGAANLEREAMFPS